MKTLDQHEQSLRVGRLRRVFRLGPLSPRRFWLLAGVLAILPPISEAQVSLTGRVTDENNAPLAGARIWLRSEKQADTETPNLQTVSDPTGAFLFHLQTSGDYLINAEREGHFRLREHSVRLQEGSNQITLVLNLLREVFEAVEVAASAPEIDFSQTASEEKLSSTQLMLQPYSNTHNLRNALRLLPGVVQDARGGIHINGSTEEQALYTLDGFNISDPLTGRFESGLSTEAVRSLELSSGRFSAEFGKGSAGAVALRTGTGDDQLRYSATRFVPGIINRKGWIINSWVPQFNLSGPLRRGRAWFSESLSARFNQNVVSELPKGQDRAPSSRVSNLLRNQINLTPSNILFTGLLFNYWNARRTGLSALDPPETTVDRRSRQYFFNVRDQIYFHRGVLLEVGYAANRTLGRETPQGHDLYLLTPQGRRGNFFADAKREARRDQWLANLFLPQFTWLGTHQLKVGIDLDRLNYWQDVRRTGFENYRTDGTLLHRIVFGGSGQFSRSNFEASSYLQDSWRVKPRLHFEVGLRQDWDQILGNITLSPRFGFAWAPPRWKHTKISGGYAVVYDATNLRLFTRPLDQHSLATTFRHDGTIERGPAVTAYTIDNRHPATPHYQNWSLGLEQRLPGSVYARFNYLRKRGRDGFAYSNAIGPATPPPPEKIAAFGTAVFDALYTLGNLRRDVYDSFEITVRRRFRNQYELFASYTRSRAFSNSVVDLNVDDPLLISNNVGRMPWDSPNRFLSWGYLPMFLKNWTVAYLLEARNGFPFSVQDEERRIVGALNSYRFPNFFELNVHFERRFRFRGYWWALRFGFNNLTNHKNPNVVNNNTSSPQFLSFFGGQTRALTFRIRWLGEQ